MSDTRSKILFWRPFFVRLSLALRRAHSGHSFHSAKPCKTLSRSLLSSSPWSKNLRIDYTVSQTQQCILSACTSTGLGSSRRCGWALAGSALWKFILQQYVGCFPSHSHALSLRWGTMSDIATRKPPSERGTLSSAVGYDILPWWFFSSYGETINTHYWLMA